MFDAVQGGAGVQASTFFRADSSFRRSKTFILVFKKRTARLKVILVIHFSVGEPYIINGTGALEAEIETDNF